MKHALDLHGKPLPVVRTPRAEDGAAIWELVRACKPLDENSMYCNLIQCDHFRETCVVAELGRTIAGWVSAYVLPDDPATLFVWQVAVSPDARGRGLGSLMLNGLLQRDACADIARIQTTITADNDASWSLFRRFANRRGVRLDAKAYYTQALHFRDRHETEHMVTINLKESMEKAA